MPKSEMEFFNPLDSYEVPWREIAETPGLREKILAKDPQTGDYTRLLQFSPGADTSSAGTMRHDFWEEVWIVDGAIHDLRLQRTFRSGMYACRPPGMAHGPWLSVDGATTLEMRYASRSADSSARQ